MPRPIHDDYLPIPQESLPDIEILLGDMKREIPNACGLKLWERVPKPTPVYPPLEVTPPIQLIQEHICNEGSACDCAGKVLTIMGTQYHNMIVSIDKSTRGQRENDNWMRMRKGIITASNTKKVVSSTDLTNTADTIIKNWNEQNATIYPAMQYGIDNELGALKKFAIQHRLKHRKCKFIQPGLILLPQHPCIGASPDAIFDCRSCGKFLVEVKCLFGIKDSHPRVAIKQRKLATKTENGMKLDEKHTYYHQIQTQMAVTNIHKAFLCLYTDKGIECIEVNFNAKFWDECKEKLLAFWKQNLFPKLTNKH